MRAGFDRAPCNASPTRKKYGEQTYFGMILQQVGKNKSILFCVVIVWLPKLVYPLNPKNLDFFRPDLARSCPKIGQNSSWRERVNMLWNQCVVLAPFSSLGHASHDMIGFIPPLPPSWLLHPCGVHSSMMGLDFCGLKSPKIWLQCLDIAARF
jgi:hypothetical protein